MNTELLDFLKEHLLMYNLWGDLPKCSCGQTDGLSSEAYVEHLAEVLSHNFNVYL